MPGKSSRSAKNQRADRAGRPPPEQTLVDLVPEVATAPEEIQHLLDTPVAELTTTSDGRAMAEQLGHDAFAVPAMVRLRGLVNFVGAGRPATQAGNLRPAVAKAAAVALGLGDSPADQVRSIDDLPELAHVFRWAVAAGFLAKRGTKIVAGSRARDLEHDALAAWLTAATTRLGYGLLDGFRRWWRKTYVELLDAEAWELLTAIFEAGGGAPVGAIEQSAWEHVVLGYGYDRDDNDERRHVVQLARMMVAQLADLGIVTSDDDIVTLTLLGSLLAVGGAAAAASANE